MMFGDSGPDPVATDVDIKRLERRLDKEAYDRAFWADVKEKDAPIAVAWERERKSQKRVTHYLLKKSGLN